VTGVECGAALVASVGVLGGGMLALGHRLSAAVGRVEALTRDAERARREAAERVAEAEAWVLGAQQVLAAERRAGDALAGVDDLLDARAAIGAMIDRAEAALEPTREVAAA
jgi:hypothetical protein